MATNAKEELAALEPRSRPTLMSLVAEAGVDVSDWAISTSGHPASNPKYCYEWAFEEPGRCVVLNLWHRHMRVESDRIVHDINMRKFVADHKAQLSTSQQRRALWMDAILQRAWLGRLPVRVIVLDGDIRDIEEEESGPSKVSYRRLDPEQWSVTRYDEGQCRVERGAGPRGVQERFDPQREVGRRAVFRAGRSYTRAEVLSSLGVADPGGGAWYTGYVQHEREHYIFCGVGSSGRTGHDYHNYFDGPDLVWRGRTGSNLRQPSIQQLLSGAPVHVFYRYADRDPFTYAGRGIPVTTKDTSPVEVKWSFRHDPGAHPEFLPDEIDPSAPVIEGAKRSVTVNVYERDPAARMRCIRRWGSNCIVCGFDFKAEYGELGEGYIHVHHLKPLGEIGEEYELDPENDLRPVCCNCHAMLHRVRPALGIEGLVAAMKSAKSVRRFQEVE
jgi:5-methylcytosine-specific restriction enzyme A